MERAELQHERAAVTVDYAPHEARVADARAAVGGAKSRLEAATENLHGAGLRHRRAAHRLVDTAQERLIAAEAALQRAEAIAAPGRHRVRDLDRQLRSFDPNAALVQILDSWASQHHPHDDLDQLRHLDAGLNRWKRWSSGERFAASELDETVAALESTGASPDGAAFRSLGYAVRSWAVEHGIDLPPPSWQAEHQPVRPGMSIEIDL